RLLRILACSILQYPMERVNILRSADSPVCMLPEVDSDLALALGNLSLHFQKARVLRKSLQVFIRQCTRPAEIAVGGLNGGLKQVQQMLAGGRSRAVEFLIGRMAPGKGLGFLDHRIDVAVADIPAGACLQIVSLLESGFPSTLGREFRLGRFDGPPPLQQR